MDAIDQFLDKLYKIYGTIKNNQRVHNFYTKVKPWIPKLWGILNTPFIVVLLSSILLKEIADSYTEKQQCIITANQAIDRYDRITLEVYNRLRDQYQAILAADTLGKLKASDAVKNRFERYTYIEFKGRTLDDLFDEYHKLSSQIFFEQPDANTQSFVIKYKGDKKLYHGDAGDEEIDDILTPIRNGYEDLSESDMPKLKAIAKKASDYIASIRASSARMLKTFDCKAIRVMP